MTLITPIGVDAAQAVLEAAEQHYERTVQALNEIIEDVTAGRSARAKELKGALSDLGRAAQTAFDERSRVAKRIRSEAGVAHDYALDFASARDEIGRRLACLRDAAGTGCVPERAE
ncbi:MAG: hypothetical protein SWN98_11920 [Pseudomonadota bacterium]|uniref:Uncharacterized protein n=1 Tax=Actibacterium naphthalenivorans TaxID=1614693 RepID=A0A840CGV2_9RHOB|nr:MULTISPECIES: hypothetical protein [Actibacterium]ALG90150.1 hypothetical protein TQ29_08100 [Actibacterium sp. EMB200-NS6]KGB83016.1 hypothetical protein JT55_03990 [Rhodovulum sp. NI22]MBB4022036.1 hypothetical protein [Actibacterium naphthalenivorans]MDY6860031.1 hypothetical protein [Pseudomonadota bacterium]